MRTKKGPTLDIGERLAVVEVKVEQDLEDGLRREEKQDDLRETIEKLAAELRTFKTEMTNEIQVFKNEMARYRGFVGGAVFVVTGIGLLFANFFGPVWSWLTRMKTG